MVAVTVPAGDPVGGRDDVDPGFQHRHIEVFVGEHAVEGQHVGLRRDDVVDGAGGRDADGCQARQLADVLTDLVRRIAVHPNQFQVGLGGDALDHLGADVAGRHLEHPDGLTHAVTFLGTG
jgi:hypothetical protein